ncbi:MAG: hypothetical protein WC764_02215 [Candidatus Paceibacterota bacterium]|jgi:hypothetical protein
MLTADKYIVRVINDARLPDIELFTDPEQGIAISVEGIAIPTERNRVARSAKEIIQRALGLLSLDTPKAIVHNTISLLKRELAEHFSKKSGVSSAHTAVIKFAWDEARGRVVAIGESDGGIKNCAYKKGKFGLLGKELSADPGDIFMQCSPSILSNVDVSVMKEILSFRKQHDLSLEQIRHLLIESAHNNLEKFRHTPLYDPRDMSVVLMEYGPVREFAGKVSPPENIFMGGETLEKSPANPLQQFGFSDLLLPEGATKDDALVNLQKVRNRLGELGYEAKIKPHHYAELPKRGDLQKVVKRAHDILEAAELREYLNNI